jgi:hypothetical protein
MFLVCDTRYSTHTYYTRIVRFKFIEGKCQNGTCSTSQTCKLIKNYRRFRKHLCPYHQSVNYNQLTKLLDFFNRPVFYGVFIFPRIADDGNSPKPQQFCLLYSNVRTVSNIRKILPLFVPLKAPDITLVPQCRS